MDAKISANAIGINWAVCEGTPVDLEKLAKGDFPEDSGDGEGGGSGGSSGGSVKAKYDFTIVMYDDEKFVG